jgi:putative ABC transport system permease protein
MRDLFGIPDDEFDIIVAQVEDTDEIGDVQEEIERYLRRERDVREGEEDFSVQSPESALEDVNSVLTGVQIFVYVIAGISILVGGFGIMNTMFTSVLERTRDIGVMKSIGARNSNIFTLFFIESGLIGMVGGIVGALVGVSLALGLAAAGSAALGSDLIKADISPLLFAGSIGGSFFLGSIFGIIPAVQAAKLHPVEALRHKK